MLDQILRGLTPGVYLLIAHPGSSSFENDTLIHFEPKDIQPLGVGRHRAAETPVYTSPRIKRLVEELGINMLSYREHCRR